MTLGGKHWRVDQILDDARINIFSERVEDALLQSKLFHHTIESGSEIADLVSRRDRDHFVKLSRFDCARAFEESAHRNGDAIADQDRENDAESRREQGQSGGDDHHLMLGAGHDLAVGLQQCEHVAAYRVETAIDVVPELVNSLHTLGCSARIFGFERAEQPVDLFVEIVPRSL